MPDEKIYYIDANGGVHTTPQAEIEENLPVLVQKSSF
jgi:hypothetical protein